MLLRLYTVFIFFFLTFYFSVVTAAASSTQAIAENDNIAVPSAWHGEAELGYVMTSGNTETDSLNAKFKVINERRKWHHKLNLEGLRASDSEQVTAKNYTALLRTEYLRTRKDYLFGALRHEYDPFAGYDGRSTAVLGYGHRWRFGETHKLDIEAGGGSRHIDYTAGHSKTEAIIRLGTNYDWLFSKTSSFKEELFTEKGGTNTYTESVSSLKMRINSKLAMKLNLTIKHNSAVPQGSKNTDSKTAVTLVYDF